MRSDEIERLLGGYATNTLTDGERKVLYEAALDDQELFNALEDEEALRDLLADRESRRKIEAALKQVPQQRLVRSWFSRPWAWGLAGSLAAACALVFVLVRLNQPQEFPTQAVLAPDATNAALAPPPEAQPPEARLQAMRRRAAVAPMAVRKSDNTQSMVNAAPATRAMVSALSQQVRAALPITILRGGSPVKTGDLIEAGDLVQFQVRAPLSGKVTLTRDGVALGTPLAVIAGQEYKLPTVPVAIEGPSRFRLVLSSVDGTTQTAEISLTPGKPL